MQFCCKWVPKEFWLAADKVKLNVFLYFLNLIDKYNSMTLGVFQAHPFAKRAHFLVDSCSQTQILRSYTIIHSKISISKEMKNLKRTITMKMRHLLHKTMAKKRKKTKNLSFLAVLYFRRSENDQWPQEHRSPLRSLNFTSSSLM